MRLLKKLQANVKTKLHGMLKRKQTLPVSTTTPTTPNGVELADRLARLERNYLVLLKRMLANDGIELQFHAIRNFTQRILTTPDDKGLNDSKPTYH